MDIEGYRKKYGKKENIIARKVMYLIAAVIIVIILGAIFVFH